MCVRVWVCATREAYISWYAHPNVHYIYIICILLLSVIHRWFETIAFSSHVCSTATANHAPIVWDSCVRPIAMSALMIVTTHTAIAKHQTWPQQYTQIYNTIHTHIHVHNDIHTYTNTYTRKSTFMYICIVYVCLICVYIYVCICTWGQCLCIYLFIYILLCVSLRL